jgi:hypothetical protein
VIGPLVIRGKVWRVVRVEPGDPFLVDRTGVPRLATTDPRTMTIRMSKAIPPHMFDQVLMHEATHAAMEESDVSGIIDDIKDERSRVMTEELLAWFLENHAIEVLDAVSRSLGRPACVRGTCAKGESWR